MTVAPILRSAALQKALALSMTRRPPEAAAFAQTLASAQMRTISQAPPVGQRSSASNPAPARTAPQPPIGNVTGSLTNVPFGDLIEAAATKYGIDPRLLAGLVKQESNFNPSAQSGVGARGLTQLMPATARGLGVNDAFDPAQSLDGGARLLSGLLKQFGGDERLALAAYNAGPGAVLKYGGVPPFDETQRYVPKVLAYANQFRNSSSSG